MNKQQKTESRGGVREPVGSDRAGKKPYNKPEILSTEPLEAVAFICAPPVIGGPGKSTGIGCAPNLIGS